MAWPCSWKRLAERVTASPRRLLLAELAQLEDSLRRFDRPSIEKGGDGADQSVANEEAELGSSLRQSKVAKIEAIKAALRRIDDGSYAKCFSCGDLIGAKRLLALPTTPFCIDCAASFERATRGDR